MSVIETFSTISSTISKLFDFLMSSEVVKEDVEEYLKTISAQTLPQKNMQALLLPYLFERRINQKSIFALYVENTDIKDKIELEIVKNLEKSFESIFEIKKMHKNGFVFKNLLNDKEYDVLPLVKMTNFRNLVNGQFVSARIFEHEKTFYLIEIANVYASYQKEEVYRYAIAKLLEKPELLYQDNPEKQKEIEHIIKEFSQKFKTLFETDEVISDNKNIDALIGLFNDYCETGNEELKAQTAQYIKQPEEFGYFKVKAFDSQYNNFIENSLNGFSSHEEKYDVGMLFDDETGLYIIPFWATIKHGFETDYKTVNNFSDGLKSLLENDKMPPFVLAKLNEKYPNFMQITNEILGENFTYDELVAKYKADYLAQKIYSATTVLYASDIFGQTVDMIETEEEEKSSTPKKVRPNDPCPCGSGKKYKKCCGAV